MALHSERSDRRENVGSLRIVCLFPNNSIYIPVGVIFDGKNHRSPDTLTPNEKHFVEFVKQHAYKNVDDFKSIDEAALNCFSFRPAACLRAGLSDAPDQVFQEINASTGQGKWEKLPKDEPRRGNFGISCLIGQQEAWPGSTQPFISASYIDGGVPNYQIFANPLPDTSEMPQNSYAEGELFSGVYIGGDNWHINESPFPIVQGGYAPENYSSEIQFINGSSPYTRWGQDNDLFFGSDEAEFSNHSPFLNSAVDISSSVKPKAVWFKIRNALKWVKSVRRYAAARRNEELFYY